MKYEPILEQYRILIGQRARQMTESRQGKLETSGNTIWYSVKKLIRSISSRLLENFESQVKIQ